MNSPKILAIQFKYLGDAVFITPALMALKQQYPEAEIHILVAKEVAPLFIHLPWIKRVWAFPRTRGKAKISESWPFVRNLRREKFDRSVDFGGNDRGAILSLLIAAKTRLAAIQSEPNWLKKLAYTQTIPSSILPISWVKRHLQLLKLAWQTFEPASVQMSIAADPALSITAKDLLQGHLIICHIGTSQPKKEWPVHRWQDFYNLARKSGYKLAFSAGTNERERDLLAELKALEPEIFTLPPLTDLALFLAVLRAAELVIVGDTGPLHFAAGLGVKVIGLFGTEDSVRHAAPIYDSHQRIFGNTCTCTQDQARFTTCQSASSCMASISADCVFDLLQKSAVT
jgi:ADP-heptose:LPS heptosyltransferase